MENSFIQMTTVSTDNSLTESQLSFTTDVSNSCTVVKDESLSADDNSLLSNGTVFVEAPRGFLIPSSDGVGNITYNNITSTVDDNGHRLVQLPVQLFIPTSEDSIVDGNAGGVYESGLNKKILCIQSVDGTIPINAPTISISSLTDATTSITSPPVQKRKGGWPKGKKRKNTPEVNAPRGPVSGYVLYAIERRQQIKDINPELPFVEVTKILGQEWSSMSSDKKQKYLEEASADKQRYIEELKVFQQSDAYRNYIIKKRKQKQICPEDNSSNGLVECADSYNPLIDVEDDSVGELHCRVCNQYFSSLHNKKEHMFGRQHLQAITGELVKDLSSEQAQQSENILGTSVLPRETTHTIVSLPTSSDSSDDQHLSDPVDMQSFIQNFLQKNSEREQEIRCLRRTLKTAHDDNISMCKEIQELNEYQDKMSGDLKNMVNYCSSLTAQIDGLKMVPTLFGVINF
ncbi:hypothetical protein SNE40_007321 [Patella caerulea]|uniref:HMG box domain-containing protein n=1 Tax=Patella caerulea TaxID=87958 RepID=A0AAN8JYK9_PATCE